MSTTQIAANGYELQDSRLSPAERTSAHAIATASVAMRTRKITADEYRAIMRDSREQHGEARHEVVKAAAFNMDDRTNG